MEEPRGAHTERAPNGGKPPSRVLTTDWWTLSLSLSFSFSLSLSLRALWIWVDMVVLQGILDKRYTRGGGPLLRGAGFWGGIRASQASSEYSERGFQCTNSSIKVICTACLRVYLPASEYLRSGIMVVHVRANVYSASHYWKINSEKTNRNRSCIVLRGFIFSIMAGGLYIIPLIIQLLAKSAKDITPKYLLFHGFHWEKIVLHTNRTVTFPVFAQQRITCWLQVTLNFRYEKWTDYLRNDLKDVN